MQALAALCVRRPVFASVLASGVLDESLARYHILGGLLILAGLLLATRADRKVPDYQTDIAEHRTPR